MYTLEVGAVGVDFNHLNAGNFHKVATVDGLEWDYVEQSQFKDPSRHDRLIIEAYHKAKANDIHIMFVGKPFISSDTIDSEIEKDLLGTVAFQETEEDIWKSPFHRMLAPDVPSCFKPWKETVIQPDGDIRVCYFHDQGEWAVSNILHTKDFMSIWNSETMVAEREAFLQTCFCEDAPPRLPVSTNGPCLIPGLDFLHSVKKNRFLIASMVKRDLKGVIQALLGMFWSLLNPLSLFCIYTFVFSVILKARAGAEYADIPFRFGSLPGSSRGFSFPKQSHRLRRRLSGTPSSSRRACSIKTSFRFVLSVPVSSTILFIFLCL